MMSLEQWGILALVVLLPLLQGVARLRRARVDNEVPPLPAARSAAPRSVRLPVVERAAEAAAAPPATVRSGQRPGPGSRALDDEKPLSGDAVAQWLRPNRNLRRAIVVAAILGPPTQ